MLKVVLNPTDVRLVLLVVDRLTNYVHFIALSHPYAASKVAALYVQPVLKLHGMPTSIISDRDPSFTSAFWPELMTLQGVQLAMFSAYIPQTDGQTEVVNKSLERYLRSFAGDRPQEWVERLPVCEFWFNTNYHTATRFTPFEALYGTPPPRLLDHVPGTSKVEAFDSHLRSWKQILSFLKQTLMLAQQIMKRQTDKHRSSRSFQIGDWVYLRLQPYKQQSMGLRASNKHFPRHFGPFQVLQ